MKRLAGGLILALIVAAGAGCISRQTGSTDVGVRTVKFSLFGKKGVEERVYGPGTYFFLPFLTDWHTFSTRLQNLEMTFNPESGDRPQRDDLLFKTIDGNDISLDVIISYRIDPAMAPHILQYVASSDQELRDKIVRTVARSRPRDIFGELKTEEFYVSGNRVEKSDRSREILNEILKPLGVIVEGVLTKDYRFNPAYQQAIEDRKVADQMAEKNKSEAKAAMEEYQKNIEDAQGEVNRMVAEVDGQYGQARLAADAYYQQQELIAQAIESEGKAEAQGIQKMNEALAGSGGEVMVKLEVARALKDKRILLVPVAGGGLDLRTTDLNRLLETYGIRAAAAGGAAAPETP